MLMVIKFDSLIVLISADCHQPSIKVRLIIRFLKLIVLTLVLIDVGRCFSSKFRKEKHKQLFPLILLMIDLAPGFVGPLLSPINF